MTTFETPSTITVDGKEYPVSGFGETIQRLVSIHTAWRNDLQKERLDVAKSEAALRALDVELSQAVQAELNPAPAADVTPAVTPAPAANDAPVAPAPTTVQ